MTATETLLEARGLVAGFGPTTVLHGVDLAVRSGETAGVFGLNGAGKSVTLKVLAGLVPARKGSVTFAGVDVTRSTPEKRVALGMGHVPQGRQVFPALTVEENLRLGAYTSRRRDRASYPARLDRVMDQFPMLASRRRQLGGTLSGGEQAALAVGRALINEPRLILVDEPSAGLAPSIVAQLLEILRGVAAGGVTIVLVEQNVAFGLALVERAHLLQSGRVVHAAPVAELDTEVLASRLGIGRMLSASTSAALAVKQPTLNGKKKRAPVKKKAAAKPVKKAVKAKKAAKATKAAKAKKAKKVR